jgi:copper chaperone CopZ
MVGRDMYYYLPIVYINIIFMHCSVCVDIIVTRISEYSGYSTLLGDIAFVESFAAVLSEQRVHMW